MTRPNSGPIIVFLGPTLDVGTARRHLAAEYRPPVRQGDVLRALDERPRAIAVVDGYFENVPAVWHKEILWAQSCGVHVFGGASMGALRAVELAPFGMVGVGWVYEAFRDGLLEDDDEVAVIHGPAELNYPILSDAMVDIRCTLARAEVQGVVGAKARAALTDVAKALWYKERSYAALLDRARDAPVARREVEDLRRWLPRGRVDQKRRDAVALLRRLHAEAAALAVPKRVDYEVRHTRAWAETLETVGSAPPGG